MNDTLEQPIISVIMSAYNAEEYIKDTINSILAQTFTKFEFIIINDASTDSTGKIIQSFNDPRIIYLENKINLGLTKNLNIALKKSRSKFIARIDADDICHKERLEIQIRFFKENPDVSIVSSSMNVLKDNFKHYWNSPKSSEEIYTKLLFQNCIFHPTVMFRKSIELSYNESFQFSQDYELWTRLAAKKFKFATIASPLVTYRIHSNQIGQRHRDKQIEASISIASSYINLIWPNSSEKNNHEHKKTLQKLYSHCPQSLISLFYIHRWFKKIFLKNKNKCFFSEEILKQELLIQWKKICKKNNLSGAVAWILTAKHYQQSINLKKIIIFLRNKLKKIL